MSISWNRKPCLEPMLRYERGDTSAAAPALPELRRKEAPPIEEGLPVPRELVTPPELLASRWKPQSFRAVCEGVDTKPSQPAVSGWLGAPRVAAVSLHGRCRYPIGIPGKPGFSFCGAASHSCSPYCRAHNTLMHCKTAPLQILDAE